MKRTRKRSTERIGGKRDWRLLFSMFIAISVFFLALYILDYSDSRISMAAYVLALPLIIGIIVMSLRIRRKSTRNYVLVGAALLLLSETSGALAVLNMGSVFDTPYFYLIMLGGTLGVFLVMYAFRGLER